MNQIRVRLENCYGIRKLEHSFSTEKGQAFLIYAPNGAMKSSFARVFSDIAAGRTPQDAIFRSRPSSHSVTDESGAPVPPERILVVEPYREDYTSDKTATLVADQDLRRKYEDLVKAIEDKAESVITALGNAGGMRYQTARSELATAFGVSQNDQLAALEALADLVLKGQVMGVGVLPYDQLINDKVLGFLNKESTRKQLAEYVARYNELIEKSAFLRPGIFNHNHAANVRKVLADNNFFKAQHTISLAARDATKNEITSVEDFEAALEQEKRQIFSDPKLTKQFDTIDKEITKNAELRQFRSLLENHPEILPELADPDLLRRRLWIAYGELHKEAVAEFVAAYKETKEKIGAVVAQAKAQQTEWQRVLEIFHRRFSVPFALEIVNQPDVMLKNQAPNLLFRYKDGNEEVEIGRQELVRLLSTGEKRALYLLNVIFEVEARKNEAGETILVLDDVADSFDYKNKYAIVEYLKAMKETGKFLMVILTHNFDFYRTVQSRLGIDRETNCFMATKVDTGIRLVPPRYLNNPLTFWRQNLHKQRRQMLAAIPLARNLVEYREGTKAEDYQFLTAVLHLKPETPEITLEHLAETLNRVLKTKALGSGERFLDVLYDAAEGCMGADDALDLESKVVLSMAIRLKAEEYMITRINDPARVAGVASNQTRKLFDIYTELFQGAAEAIAILDRVMLMTPESIHLNSFMYEPILDMSAGHLWKLYQDVKALAASVGEREALPASS